MLRFSCAFDAILGYSTYYLGPIQIYILGDPAHPESHTYLLFIEVFPFQVERTSQWYV
jgi:hypothetical protein